MRLWLTFTFSDDLRRTIGRILKHKRPATRTELIQFVTAAVTAEIVQAENFDANRDTDLSRDVPGQLGLFVAEKNAAQKLEAVT